MFADYVWHYIRCVAVCIGILIFVVLAAIWFEAHDTRERQLIADYTLMQEEVTRLDKLAQSKVVPSFHAERIVVYSMGKEMIIDTGEGK